ncbi:hypothetical protein A9Q99_27730 [Gammaproteobacteria bacterium 45_16_T64]|nr:hypothetical protein A9Q99_27730 [Gammaproteobacteria bacterium 45_16_T64]
MVYTNVPFERRFASLSDERLRDPDYMSIWGSQKSGCLSWDELHKYRCVVVLGEGKCGKTHEFKQQNRKLRAADSFSFFVPLELLQDSDLFDVISEEEENEFEQWLDETDNEAVFFLDAVDELKLRKGTLRKALRKITTAIGSQLHRARFFVSCRPNDWKEELDLGVIASLVAPRERIAKTTESPNGEEVFSAVITREEFANSQQEAKKEDVEEPVKVLGLLPLSRNETVEFAELYAPDQAKTFETYLEEKELLHLYQLPADIISAMDQLVSEGRLGNLEEQLAFGIGQKLRELSDKKRNSLSEGRAVEGVERIALALFLMKRRSVYLDSTGGDADGVGVADLLADWSPEEQIELHGKPIFDQTGVGAVRFHHRSTQEFLAAHRLNKLRASGLATADLFNLLFANIGDEKVIVPSMEPVVAWMALWNSDILAEVKGRNPLLLFRQGIPVALNIELRSELIRIFVERFSGSKWRGIGIGHQELKRVATPELAPVVRELWEQAYLGHDTRELLLELIYLTPMSECTDLAFQAAFDENLPYHHRTYAVWAILRCGTIQQKRNVGARIVAGDLPERMVRNALSELLPEAINLEEFLILARSLTELSRSVHGLGYALLQTIKSDAVASDQKTLIRNSFTQSIWGNRTSESRVYQAHSQYDHFVDAVIAACNATLPTTLEKTPSWAWCLAVAFHFGERRTSIIAKDETEKLQQLLSTEVSLREAFFWACFDIAEMLDTQEDDWQRFVRTDYDHLLRPFTQADFPWLLLSLSPNAIEERRGVAFYTLSMFIRGGDNPELAEQISGFLSDRADLREEFEKILNPPSREPDKYEIERRKREKELEAEDAARIDGWKRWREEVLADGDFLLDEAGRENTLYNLHKAVQNAEGNNGSWGHWNSTFVETAFSYEFLNRVREEFSRYWRQVDIQLYSERPEGSRNSYPASNLIALSAVKCSAETPGWAKALSNEEAIRVVRISTIELNGFANFLSQIEEHHPQAVKEVIFDEVQAQVVNLLDAGNAPILHDILYHGTPNIQECAASSIVSNLATIVAAMPEGNRADIKYAFGLIVSQGSDEAVQDAVGAIQALLDGSNHVSAEERNFWILTLGELDLESACEYVLGYTNDLSTKEMRDDAISLFAALFGERHMGGQLTFDGLEPGRRLNQLQQLVIRSYQAVQPKDDFNHEGSDEPNTRDHAEQARSYLLQCLATTNSPRTLSSLYELSSLPEFALLSDRLKQMAKELAAQISEPEAMNAVTFRKFDQELSYLPYDDPSLFAVMSNRLRDFEHHLINDEQSTVDTLRRVDTETELRRFISFWLGQNSRGSYTITQEAVVIAEKRTDIRLHASNLDKYASIELKLDDTRNKWSGTQLREALVEQLVGRYLNHERCQVGCLLVCMRETRRWECPDTKERMDLITTVAWLQGIANEIMEERPELLILVMGIDYSTTANG